MTDSDHPTLSRRGLLGGVASLAAATSFSLSMSDRAAAQVQSGDDSATQSVTSPDGRVELTVDVSDGSLTYSVTHDGEAVLDESAVAFDFQNQPSLGADLTVTGSERSTTDETWQPVWDQYDEIRNHFQELRVGLAETAGPERALTFAARAYDDGVAFRLLFPEDSGFGEFVVTDERTQFAFAGDHTAWWIQNDYNSYEYEYGESNLTQIYEGSPDEGAHTPLTMRTENGRYLSVHEADLVDYASMSVVGTESGSTTMETDLAPWPDGTKVKAEAPHRTPWRTLQIGERPGALVESNLIVNCNPPRDPEQFPQGTDWIEPQKFMGIWWLMITSRADWQYYGENQGNHAATTERMKQYMEFASEHGIPSVLVEGWNQGWDSYPGQGDTMDFTETYPDFDIEEVTEYGAELDPPVEMTAHNETAGNINNYESQLTSEDDHPFALYDELGIHTIKTGYVADSGVSVDGRNHNHHCQPLVNHHRLVYREAAKHRQMLEIHEPVKPTGERRRFPNVMTKEGVFGQEYDSFGRIEPEQHVTYPFTRMLGGPMEFTPGIFDMDSGSGGIETTRAKQLAMYPTYFSGLHMVADLPSSYIADQEPRATVGEVFQAEFGETDAVDTAARWGGAQGEAYVAFELEDEEGTLTWTVEADSAGEYDLHVRYSASNGTRRATIAVGDSETELAMSGTEYWDTWQTAKATVELDSGDNEVTMSVADIGGFNVDAIAVTETGESMPEPESSPIRAETVEAFQFVEDVPAAGWDDTVVVDAEIRDYTAVARQHGEEWFLGVMTDELGRVLDVPLDFLGDGEYVAEIYTDGVEAAYDTNLSAVAREEGIVTGDTTLQASVVGSGGTAVRFRPAEGEDTSDVPAYEAPTQDIDATVRSPVAPEQSFVEITGSNDAPFVGGTLVEVEVDGEVDLRRNVRLPAGASDATVELPVSSINVGSYEVTVRLVDGETLASGTVSVEEGAGETTTTAGDSETDDGSGPGFGAVSGVLGTAGGAAYAARRLLDSDESAEPED